MLNRNCRTNKDPSPNQEPSCHGMSPLSSHILSREFLNVSFSLMFLVLATLKICAKTKLFCREIKNLRNWKFIHDEKFVEIRLIILIILFRLLIIGWKITEQKKTKLYKSKNYMKNWQKFSAVKEIRRTKFLSFIWPLTTSKTRWQIENVAPVIGVDCTV